MQRTPREHHADANWKTAPLVTALAGMCVLLASIWLANKGSVEEQPHSSAPLKRLANSVAQAAEAEPLAPFTFGDLRPVKDSYARAMGVVAGTNHGPNLIPEEWEKPLFDILLNKEQSIDQRNLLLLQLAVGPARGVAKVQEECVKHLLFGLSDDNGLQFLAIATNASIPLTIRAEFLKQTLSMRPQSLGEWLSQQVSNHHESEISSIARPYLWGLRETSQ